ncbi:MAG: riboflavin synthase [Bacteroidales bacterium]|nr:riboflavin synthase [Bacteroidales bacterium]
MFTGIIEETGFVKEVRKGAGSAQVRIGAERVLQDAKIGDSINTSGVCLTVVAIGPGSFTVDVMPETMERTVIGLLKTGSRVNLERAVRLSDRLGGHLVSGHIDGTGTIDRRWAEGNAIWFVISAGKGILRYIIPKGSVAIDGISLTVAGIDEHTFRVSIIPHTAGMTTLPDRKAGDRVNIECDVVGKYIEKFIQPEEPGGKIDMDFLGKYGF